MLNRPQHEWIPEPSSPARWDCDQNPYLRLAVLWLVMVLPLGAVVYRLAVLQIALPEKFTAVFGQTTETLEDLPSRDGRILASDGSILATDKQRYDVTLHYRWLEETPQEEWLTAQAMARLSRKERRDRAKVAAEKAKLTAERQALWERLAATTGHNGVEFRQQRDAIEARVEKIRAAVLERREKKRAAEPSRAAPAEGETLVGRFWRSVVQELTAPPERHDTGPFAIAEELQYHPVLVGVDAESAAEIEAHPELFPGVRIDVSARRVYPHSAAAAHIIGSRTPLREDEIAARKQLYPHGDPLDYRLGDRIGRNGLEQAYDSHLRGLRGLRKIVKNRRGEIISTEIVRAPRVGQDLILSVDLVLQQTAERLLSEALEPPKTPGSVPATDLETPPEKAALAAPAKGGSVVVMDVHSGAVLVAASAPGFDANLLSSPDAAQWEALVNDPRRPFFPRASRMALAPGSTFKTLTAMAAIEGGLDPSIPVQCGGYLDHPNQHRCLIFRHYGLGHGETRLGDALARSCNVYFFKAARKIGPVPLVEWSHRLGFGQRTGIDLPFEEPGFVPSPQESKAGKRPWYPGDTLGLAIGQSRLQVTPLQMTRLMAAVANDGLLVTPRLAAEAGPQVVGEDGGAVAGPGGTAVPPRAIPGLSSTTLGPIRVGLDMVVNAPEGTAYKSVRSKAVAIAGKTGTAETGGGQPDHAWFAGYVPADKPRYAFTVVLEHGGSGGKTAGPIARQLVETMVSRGLLGSQPLADAK